jgi:hypothetical protein
MLQQTASINRIGLRDIDDEIVRETSSALRNGNVPRCVSEPKRLVVSGAKITVAMRLSLNELLWTTRVGLRNAGPLSCRSPKSTHHICPRRSFSKDCSPKSLRPSHHRIENRAVFICPQAPAGESAPTWQLLTRDGFAKRERHNREAAEIFDVRWRYGFELGGEPHVAKKAACRRE